MYLRTMPQRALSFMKYVQLQDQPAVGQYLAIFEATTTRNLAQDKAEIKCKQLECLLEIAVRHAHDAGITGELKDSMPRVVDIVAIVGFVTPRDSRQSIHRLLEEWVQARPQVNPHLCALAQAGRFVTFVVDYASKSVDGVVKAQE